MSERRTGLSYKEALLLKKEERKIAIMFKHANSQNQGEENLQERTEREKRGVGRNAKGLNIYCGKRPTIKSEKEKRGENKKFSKLMGLVN